MENLLNNWQRYDWFTDNLVNVIAKEKDIKNFNQMTSNFDLKTILVFYF